MLGVIFWILFFWCEYTKYLLCLINNRVSSLSVQLSRSVVSDSLRPHESQHTRPPFPSPTPEVHSNSCASSRWCHPAISSSVIPFSSCPHSLPESESFPMSQLFAWGGQSFGVSASASVLSVNTQDWSPLGWTVAQFKYVNMFFSYIFLLVIISLKHMTSFPDVVGIAYT